MGCDNSNLIGCIIETKNPAIIRMMKSRGCQCAEDNGVIQFSKEPTLAFTKKYRDDLQLNIIGKCNLSVNGANIPIEGTQAWKTSTGWEHLFIANVKITDKKTKKTSIKQAKGIGVFSEKQNHYYCMFQIEGTNVTLYMERWFDEKSNKVVAKKGSDFQSDRIYEI